MTIKISKGMSQDELRQVKTHFKQYGQLQSNKVSALYIKIWPDLIRDFVKSKDFQQMVFTYTKLSDLGMSTFYQKELTTIIVNDKSYKVWIQQVLPSIHLSDLLETFKCEKFVTGMVKTTPHFVVYNYSFKDEIQDTPFLGFEGEEFEEERKIFVDYHKACKVPLKMLDLFPEYTDDIY